jgi:rhodanese-related sulfurtransferase
MNQLFTSSMVIMIGAVMSVPPMALAQSFPPVVTQKVQAAQKQVKTIGMEEYRKVVESPGDALIVDVREPHEYAAGHVPGATNIPRGLLEFQIWKHVGFPANTEMGRTVYLQCQSGNRASRGTVSCGAGVHAHHRRGDEPRRLAKGRPSVREVSIRRRTW